MRYAARRFTALALSAAMAATLFPATPLAFAEQASADEPAAAQGPAAQGDAGATDTAGDESGTDTQAGTPSQAETPGTQETQTDAQAAQKVTDEIAALPKLSAASASNAKAIRQAHKDLGALSTAQKALVPKAQTTKLTRLYNALSAADKLAKEIEGLPAASSATNKDYAKIADVSKRYRKLAQPAFVKDSLHDKMDALDELVAYSADPVPIYKVKALGTGKVTTVRDDDAHSYKGGIAKVKVLLPKSGYDSSTTLSGSMSYAVKVAGKKASSTKKGAWVGTSSKKRIVQAVKLDFSGTLASHYTAWYRVKVSKLGWSSWASDGTWAGSTGMNLRITGLQVKFEKKDGAAPGSTARPCPGKSTLSYRVNRLEGGWTSFRKSGSTAGSATWDAGIKQLRLKETGTLGGSVQASVLTRKGDWTDYTSGTAGSGSKSKQAQAVRIRLTGELSKVYNVYYRVYASDHHWLGWARNGQNAGTSGHKYPMGAIQVKLVLKGDGAPGSTREHFTTKAVSHSEGGQLTMTRKAQKYSSSTNWLILVNRSTTHVGIFKGSKNDWQLVRYILCDVGATSTPTPTGTRRVQYRIPSFGEEEGYSVYKATNIGGGYFFHSILYYANTRNVMDGTLGAWCSHGCIRMSYDNASYIYNNVSNGTTVKIY